MPRYDYRCASCEHEFELIQKPSEVGKGICPQCAGESRRVFHAVPVIYKGSGFYTTDYGRPKAPVEKEGGKSGDDSGHDQGHGHSHDHGHSHSHGGESAPAAKTDSGVKPSAAPAASPAPAKT